MGKVGKSENKTLFKSERRKRKCRMVKPHIADPYLLKVSVRNSLQF